MSAQQTIPYVAMYPDGVCQLPGGLFTKTVEYEDINYSVASSEDQSAIFSGWSAFLNYFDSALPFQLSFVNRRAHSASRYKVNIPAQQDAYDSIRGEFVSMLKRQIAKSNNGIDRAKYITFGVPAGTLSEARPRLARVEADVVGNLHRLGVQSRPLDGQERLGCFTARHTPAAGSPSGSPGRTSPARAWAPRMPLPPAPGLTSPNPACSGWGGIGARRPTCKFWRLSSQTSCCGRFWSWMRS